VEIPIKYQQKTFGYLFKCLAQEYKILCIGVYRDLTHLEEVNNNSRPYVYLKPPNNENDFLIQTNDKAYVLTSKFPSQSNILFPYLTWISCRSRKLRGKRIPHRKEHRFPIQPDKKHAKWSKRQVGHSYGKRAKLIKHPTEANMWPYEAAEYNLLLKIAYKKR